MRRIMLAFPFLCTLVSAPPAAGQAAAIPAAIADARQALRGPGLATIRTLRITGRSVRAVGPLELTSDVEIRLALPDKYLRIDRLTVAGISSSVTSGFDGPALIRDVTRSGGRRLDPAGSLPAESRAQAADAAAIAVRQDFALLLLGLLGDSFESYPLAFAGAGTAEAPDGMADVVSVRGRTFAGAAFIDGRSRLPLMVRWDGPDTPALMQAVIAAPERGRPPSGDALRGLAASAEHRLYFLDHRRVGSFDWPFLLRHSIGGVTVDELRIDTFTIDPRFGPEAFEGGR